jgi:hypothetical protein
MLKHCWESSGALILKITKSVEKRRQSPLNRDKKALDWVWSCVNVEYEAIVNFVPSV